MGEPSLLPFPYEFWDLTPEEQREVDQAYPSPPTGYTRVGPKGYIVYTPYIKDAANIYNMPLRSSDIFVASYQRSGTTLTQELVWLIANDLDYDTAAKKNLNERYPFLESFMFFEEEKIDKYVENATKQNIDPVMIRESMKMMAKPVSGMLASAPSPRYIKTHLPMSLLPPKILDTAKVVYVARDPRDVVVSSFHHAKLFKMMGLEGDFKQFWDLFRKNIFALTPYFEHLKEAWEKRDEPNMLFLFYEDLLKDLPAAVRRVAKFLGKEVNVVQMEVLCDYLSFDKFKKNKSVNYEEFKELGVLASNENFIRQGKSGGWRDYFDEEMTQQAEQWIRDNLSNTDLRFPTINLMKL